MAVNVPVGPTVSEPSLVNDPAVKKLAPLRTVKLPAAAFVAKKGAIQVRNAAELEQAVRGLLENPDQRQEFGRNALQVVTENLGSIERTVAMIVKRFRKEDVHGLLQTPPQ